MGLYSLARRENVKIVSSLEDGEAWQVKLAPGHFVGEFPAPVERFQRNRQPAGTEISFNGETASKYDVGRAARYYPLPVTLNEEQVEQDDFLRGACHTEEWRGIRIGVYRSPENTNFHHKRMNFYGITVDVPRLGKIQSIRSTWTAQADVLDCPGLDLTLPARREVVETPFTEELRLASSAAIYRAMLQEEGPVDVPKKVQDDAAFLGIILPDARAMLRKWQPRSSRDSFHINNPFNKWEEAPEDALLLDRHDSDTWEQQVTFRAAELNQMDGRLFHRDSRLAGYGWYDRLTRVEDIEITVTGQDGEYNLLENLGEDHEERPDRIVVKLQTDQEDENGDPVGIALPTDLAFNNNEHDYMDEIQPMVTRDSGINIEDLTEIMLDSLFFPSDDSGADSLETQEDDHETAFRNIATELLLSREEAVRESIEHAVARYVRHHIPRHTNVTINMMPEQQTRITIEPAE